MCRKSDNSYNTDCVKKVLSRGGIEWMVEAPSLYLISFVTTSNKIVTKVSQSRAIFRVSFLFPHHLSLFAQVTFPCLSSRAASIALASSFFLSFSDTRFFFLFTNRTWHWLVTWSTKIWTTKRLEYSPPSTLTPMTSTHTFWSTTREVDLQSLATHSWHRQMPVSTTKRHNRGILLYAPMTTEHIHSRCTSTAILWSLFKTSTRLRIMLE